jgi:hypothetical protein
LIQKHDLIFPYNEKILDLLRLWSAYLTNVEDHTWIEGLELDRDDIDKILLKYSETERDMGRIYIHRSHFHLAEGFCERALSYARQYKGEGAEKTSVMYNAVTEYSSLRLYQANFADAVVFAEEAYNVVAMAYNPVHPEVQQAAGALIDCLVNKGDYI